MEPADVVIIGGGIGGLAAAWRLAGRGRVVVLERENQLGEHATGRNAAIFRLVDPGPSALELSVQSRVLLDALFEGRRAGWLAQTGAWYTAPQAEPVEALYALARGAGVESRLCLQAGWEAAAPLLEGGDTGAALHVPGDGAMDVHAVVTALTAAARRAQVDIRRGAGVSAIDVRAGRVRGVVLEDGERLPTGHVIIAAGAWAAGLGDAVGAPLPLEPRRRHLAVLETDPPPDRAGPVLWRVTDPIYLRPESGGLLASPCDETVWPPGLPPVDDEALISLGEKLAAFAPGLREARVRRAWSGLRTFAPDGGFVAGADPRVQGLHWVAGLGGHGMSGGLSAGEVVAAGIQGRVHPLARALSPARLL